MTHGSISGSSQRLVCKPGTSDTNTASGAKLASLTAESKEEERDELISISVAERQCHMSRSTALPTVSGADQQATSSPRVPKPNEAVKWDRLERSEVPIHRHNDRRHPDKL